MASQAAEPDLAAGSPVAQSSQGSETLEEMRMAFQKLHAMVFPAASRSWVHVQDYAAVVRPWREFIIVAQPQVGPGFQKHVEQNLEHYQANYMLVFVVLFLLNVLSHPMRFTGLLIAAGGWTWYLAAGGLDPNWRPWVYGVELTPVARMIILSTATLAWVFIVAGEALFVLAGLLAFLSVCHAACHPGATAAQVVADAVF
mmetsp:Transcript_98162/g.194392  ORF Transcript_98162/g.194392 Transcript_98162/m.194392 type:complete len:200 (-) Transcript_98162:58-657(-)